jgi:CspA family cold shock protein
MPRRLLRLDRRPAASAARLHRNPEKSGDGDMWLSMQMRGKGRGAHVMPQQGTVKFFNLDKGYGFIKPADGGRDIFVHISAVEAAGLTDLPEGKAINFDIEPDKKGKGPKAVNLKLEAG